MVSPTGVSLVGVKYAPALARIVMIIYMIIYRLNSSLPSHPFPFLFHPPPLPEEADHTYHTH